MRGRPGELVESFVGELDVGGGTPDGHCVVCGAPEAEPGWASMFIVHVARDFDEDRGYGWLGPVRVGLNDQDKVFRLKVWPPRWLLVARHCGDDVVSVRVVLFNEVKIIFRRMRLVGVAEHGLHGGLGRGRGDLVRGRGRRERTRCRGVAFHLAS